MKDFIKLLRRFIPPYRKQLGLNILYNILSAIFGAFSFGLLIPALEILFSTKDLVTQRVPWEFSLDALLQNFNFFISRIISQYGHERALIYIGLFIVLMVFLKVGFSYLSNFSMIEIRNGVVRDIRLLIYKQILRLPLGYFSEERKGDIMARMTGDVTEVENSIMNSLDMMIKNPILILISVGVMFYMSWSLTLFVFVMFPIAGFIIGRIGRSLKRESRIGQDKMGDILSLIEEDLSGLRVIKSFNAEESATKRFARENQSYFLTMNRLMWRRFLAHPVSEFLGTTVIIMVLWYGGKLILNNESSLNAAAFIGYLVFFYNIINPAKAFSTALYSVEKGLASMERIDKILLSKSNIFDKPDAVEITKLDHQIKFEDVSFAYNSSPVLQNVSLTINKGKFRTACNSKSRSAEHVRQPTMATPGLGSPPSERDTGW